MNRSIGAPSASKTFGIEPIEVDALDVLLAEHSPNGNRDFSPATSAAFPGVVVGTVIDVHDSGEVFVRLSQEAGGQVLAARCIVAVDRRQVGAEAAIAFENGCRDKPIVLGLLSAPGPASSAPKGTLQAVVDKKTLELSADREIVLRCGKASITLTRAGKVIIRGAYLLSRSSGVNRIKGGSVQIN